ncbi:MAG: putative toxin-antitoxin system toxin component, PIN family [Bacteroidales bacterium]|nr:putative toxin-antitoxin system toxin component, PIN family [Bacteroidales bacterium]MBP5517633.1 putative toxin-antitoxin system toxin component, PIN family [Bacteroidales bacterium]
MKVFAVIDTNVIVSALLSPLQDSATVIIREKIEDGTVVPLFNDEILNEYKTVLSRSKFGFPECLVIELLETIRHQGLSMERTKTNESFIDINDIVFYEVALSKEGSYLVTGNIRHYPRSPIVVTPSQLLKIISDSIESS